MLLHTVLEIFKLETFSEVSQIMPVHFSEYKATLCRSYFIVVWYQSCCNPWYNAQYNLWCHWLKELLRKANSLALQNIISWDIHREELCIITLIDICMANGVKLEGCKLRLVIRKKSSSSSICLEFSKLNNDTKNFRHVLFSVQSRILPNFSDVYRNNQLLNSVTNVVCV